MGRGRRPPRRRGRGPRCAMASAMPGVRATRTTPVHGSHRRRRSAATLRAEADRVLPAVERPRRAAAARRPGSRPRSRTAESTLPPNAPPLARGEVGWPPARARRRRSRRSRLRPRGAQRDRPVPRRELERRGARRGDPPPLDLARGAWRAAWRVVGHRPPARRRPARRPVRRRERCRGEAGTTERHVGVDPLAARGPRSPRAARPTVLVTLVRLGAGTAEHSHGLEGGCQPVQRHRWAAAPARPSVGRRLPPSSPRARRPAHDVRGAEAALANQLGDASAWRRRAEADESVVISSRPSSWGSARARRRWRPPCARARRGGHRDHPQRHHPDIIVVRHHTSVAVELLARKGRLLCHVDAGDQLAQTSRPPGAARHAHHPPQQGPHGRLTAAVFGDIALSRVALDDSPAQCAWPAGHRDAFDAAAGEHQARRRSHARRARGLRDAIVVMMLHLQAPRRSTAGWCPGAADTLSLWARAEEAQAYAKRVRWSCMRPDEPPGYEIDTAITSGPVVDPRASRDRRCSTHRRARSNAQDIADA